MDRGAVNYWGSATLIVLTMLYNAVVHCVQYCIWSVLIHIHAGLDIVPFHQSSTAKNVKEWQDLLLAIQIDASELNDPICHSNECQIGSFSSEAM